MDRDRSLGIIVDYVNYGDIATPDLSSEQSKIVNNLRDYYTMEWTLNGQVVDVNSRPITASTTFVAKWTPIQYRINYNNIGYTRVEYYSIESGRYNYFIPEKEHYFFKAWCTTSSYNPYTEVSYRMPGAIGDVELYAHWTPREYNITYHTDAENRYNPESYNIEDIDIKLMSISKEGYTFKGWYLDKDCTQSITTISKGSYGNLDLYPLWEAKTYTVTYIMPNGTKYMINCKYGEKAELPDIDKNIFQIVVTDKSIKNITGDTQVTLKLHNIWYLYLLGLLALAGGVVGIVFLIRKRNDKHTHLRYMYHSNHKNKRL
jgi:uncharacterized repeat protein (TIGR02543 family)